MRLSIVLAALALSTVAFSQSSLFSNDGVYQLGYAANLNIGDSVLNITNDGFNGGFFGSVPPTRGNICANVYVFDPREEEIGCCACLVTPNGLNSLSAKADLISNNLTPDVPTSIVIKLLGSTPGTTGTGAATVFNVCNPATAGGTAPLALTFGMVAWGTTLEPASTPGTYATVNVPYATGQLALASHGGFIKVDDLIPPTGRPVDPGSELAALTSVCNFIQSNGSNFGICRSCRLGALGGAKQ